MKRLLVPLLALWIAPMLAHAAESTCSSLVITGHPAYPPVAWASDGKIVGAGPKLVASIARKLGVKKVTSKSFGSWEKAQMAAKAGQADIILGIYKNDERMTYLDYIDPPFMVDPVAVAVRKGESFPYQHWDSLKGKKGVTNAGESYGNKLDAFIASDLTVARVPGVGKAFEALLDKQADYLIIGLYPGQNEARLRGIAGKIEFLPKELVTSDMYVAFSKQSKCAAKLRTGFAANTKAAVEKGKVKQLLDAAQTKLSAPKKPR